MTNRRVVSATRIINAPRAEIFRVLATPSLHPIIDGSGSVEAPTNDPGTLFLGAKFGMAMKLGLGYKVQNTVSTFEQDRAIAWHHFARFIWRYDLEDVDGGTKVTESFDYSNAAGIALALTAFPKNNQANMEKTLVRLERYVTTGSAD
jgi:uncharacterized protein YndB with AHSA1/START domain